MQQYFPLLLLAVAAVALFVLPARQRKRQQAQQQALRDSLAPGTAVMTTAGLHGTVARKGEGTVDLEIAPGVVVTFAQQAILEVRKPAAGAEPSVGLDKPAPGGTTPGGAVPGNPLPGSTPPGDTTPGGLPGDTTPGTDGAR